MSLSNTLFPVPLRPSTARVSPAAHAQADPIQNPVASKALMQVLDGDNRHTAVSLDSFSCFIALS